MQSRVFGHSCWKMMTMASGGYDGVVIVVFRVV